MKIDLNKLSDIDKLPSVLPIEDVNHYLEQLMLIINRNPTLNPLISAEAINNLIGYQGYNTEGLSKSVSAKILEWTKKIYKSDDIELMECCSANLANLTCREAKDYIVELIANAESEEEKSELEESLKEIQPTDQCT